MKLNNKPELVKDIQMQMKSQGELFKKLKKTIRLDLFSCIKIYKILKETNRKSFHKHRY
jgi:hypothetical protein